MGDDRIVDEGDLVVVAPTIVDPLGRGGDPYAYAWQVEADNGQVIAGGSDASFQFTPFDNGVYTLRLFVTDVDRGLVAYPATLMITSLNVAPALQAGDDRNVDEGTAMDITVAFSDPGSNDTHTAVIDWGDGTASPPSSLVESDGAGELAASHVYADDGEYLVTVTLTDDDGASSADSFLVSVDNVPPTVDAGDDITLEEGMALLLGDFNPEGAVGQRFLHNVLFNDPGSLDSHTASIDWGDGIVETGLVVEAPFGPPGSADGLNGFVAGAHAYADDGVYTVTVTVTDDEDAIHSDSFTVTVDNALPFILPGAQLSAEGEVTELEAVTFVDPGTLDTHSATIDWGDGTPVEIAAIAEAPFGPPGSTTGLMGLILGSHVYADNDTYTVTFTLVDDDGGVATQTLTRTIEVENQDPLVEAGSPITVDEGEAFTLDGISFVDPGTLDTHTASIDWTDGTVTDGTVTETPFGPPGSSDGMTGSVATGHTFGDNGDYAVLVTVSDDDGGSGSDTVVVSVLNVAPSVDAGDDLVAPEGTPVDILANFSDAGSLDTHTASIDWGDGNTTPALVDALAGTVSGTHSYSDNGPYLVTVTVTDDDGDSGSDSVVVSIENAAPMVTPNTGFNVDEAQAFDAVLAAFLDPGIGDLHSATVDWGDGDSGPALVTEASGAGIVSAGHAYADDGIYTVTVTVSDDDGGVGIGEFFITVDNLPPIALPESFEINEDQALLVAAPGLLGNDSDVPADVLSAVEHTAPAHGTLQLNGDGSLTYTPDADFNGGDSFVYQAMDDDGGLSDPTTVTITVLPVNDAPSFVAGPNVQVQEDAGAQLIAGWAGSVSAGPADESGQSLVFDVQVDDPSLFSVQPVLSLDGQLSFTPAPDAFGTAVVTVTLSDDGGTERGGVDASAPRVFTISIGPVNDRPVAQSQVVETDEDVAIAGMLTAIDVDDDDLIFQKFGPGPINGTLLLNDDGSFVYTPNADFNGVDGFGFVVFDGQVFSTFATVQINVLPVNDAPLAVDDVYMAIEDTPLPVFFGFLGVLANDSDVDGDSLSAILDTGPAHGALNFAPDGTFTYTPAADFAGMDSFSYHAFDGQLPSNVATVTVNVQNENDLPVADAAVFDLDEDTVLEEQVTAFDADGDMLTYHVLVGPAFGDLIMNADGSFSYTPDMNYFGDDAFQFFASDAVGDGSIATVNLQINAVNDAPVAVDDSYEVNEDQTLIVLTGADGVLGNDSDVDSVAFLVDGIVSGPDHGSLNLLLNGAFSYTPDPDFFGQDSFVYRARDIEGLLSDPATVTIDVINVNDAPLLDAVDDQSVDEGSTLSFSAGVFDADLPADTLTFSLGAGAPAGAAIDAASGLFTWTPTEAQGPGDFDVEILVQDAAGLTDGSAFTVSVAEVPSAPLLDAIGDRSVNEGEELVLVLGASDDDLPAQALSFDLTGLPAGASFDPASREFRWTPGEDQGPDTVTLTATVSDDTGLSDAETFDVTVVEVNTPPVIAEIDDQVVTEGELLSFMASATDADLPANNLTFTLNSGAPAGAKLTPQGLFTWTPGEAQGPAVYTLTIRVSDGKGPIDSTTFDVTVLEDETIDAGPAAGDGDPDVFGISRSGDEVLVTVNGMEAYRAALAGVPSLTINGSGDDDSLSIDFSGGDPVPGGGIFYNGGGSGDDDVLALSGSVGSVSHMFSGPGAGSVQVDGSVITYTGLEPIFDSLAASQRSFTFAGGADLITLGDDDVAGNGVSRLASPSSETVDFVNPSDALLLQSGGGNDVITVLPLDAGAGGVALTIDAGAGDDTIDLSANTAAVTLLMGSGNDTIIGGGANLAAQLFGSEGDDQMQVVQAGNRIDTTVNGVAASLTHTGFSGLEVFALGGDDDIILQGLDIATVVDAGAGNDHVDGAGVDAIGLVLHGGGDDDTLIGGSADDDIFGDAGNDQLIGGGGDDNLIGGDGNDGVELSGEPADYTFGFSADMPLITDTRPLSPIGVAYWSFNEVSGPTAADTAGTPQNGTYFGSIDKNDAGPPLSLAPFGAQSATEFKRTTSQYVAVAHDPVFELNEGTLALWFNTDTTSGNRTLFSKDHSGFVTGGHLNIRTVGSRIEVRLQSDDTSYTILTGNIVNRNQWQHLVFSFGEQGMRLYLNGALVGSNAYTGGLMGNHEPIVIGASIRSNTNNSGNLNQLGRTQPFDGHIDEVSLFAGQLSAEQIARLPVEGAQALVDEAQNGPSIDGGNLLQGIEAIGFADGAQAYVLGGGSANAPELSVPQVVDLAGAGPLLVIGNEDQTLTLLGDWSDAGAESVGANAFNRFTSGSEAVLAQQGINTILQASPGVVALQSATPNLATIASPLEPVAYWAMNETGGALIADSAGIAQNGTYVGSQENLGAPGMDGELGAGTSLRFNGRPGEYVAVAHDVEFELSNGTVQLWFNADSLRGKHTLFAKDAFGFGDGGYLSIGSNGSRLEVRLKSGDATHVIRTERVIEAHTWHQLALTFGEGGMKLYLDAKLVGENGYRGGLIGNREPIVIGASVRTNRFDNGDLSRLHITRAFDGRIDEVALLGVALDAAQVAQLRSAGALGVRASEHDDAAAALLSAEALAAPLVEADPVPATWWQGALAKVREHGHSATGAELRERLAELNHDWLVVSEDHGRKEAGHNAAADSEHAGQAEQNAASDWIVDTGDEQHASKNDNGHKGLVDWSRGAVGSVFAKRDGHGKGPRSK
jgi:VCBS repeat-containing protein